MISYLLIYTRISPGDLNPSIDRAAADLKRKPTTDPRARIECGIEAACESGLSRAGGRKSSWFKQNPGEGLYVARCPGCPFVQRLPGGSAPVAPGRAAFPGPAPSSPVARTSFLQLEEKGVRLWRLPRFCLYSSRPRKKTTLRSVGAQSSGSRPAGCGPCARSGPWPWGDTDGVSHACSIQNRSLPGTSLDGRTEGTGLAPHGVAGGGARGQATG